MISYNIIIIDLTFRLHINNIGFYDHSTGEELLRECIKMKDLDHPNILKLIGICIDGGPAPFIITPFMENGSLLSYLRKNRNTFLPTEDNVYIPEIL
jgi:serine/threonine protein kinase